MFSGVSHQRVAPDLVRVAHQLFSWRRKRFTRRPRAREMV